jgi:antitoxin (DNA-binding transcriptional repressor) of toxin-antitoxin stability system
MKRARIAALKNNLSRYLDHVRAGGSVLVLDRDQPIAQIVPLESTARGRAGNEDQLQRLERRGLIRRGAGGLPNWLGRRRPPRVRGSVLRDLLNQRAGGW